MEAKKEVQEKEEYVSDSEYHTGSEFQPEFQSDNEPPEDKVAEAKLVVKHNDIRVYKKIIKIGTGMHMPAKYDKVVHRLVETPEETLSAVCLDGVEFVEKQMGITLLDQEIIYCLEHMRQGEISSFKIEHVTYTEKKKRILESERFLVAEMKSWETYIDLRGDFLCMKHMKKRGVGQKRFNILDEISFKARIYQDETNILRTYDANDTLVGNLVPRIPTTLVDMLMSSKAKEDLSVVCKPEYWLQFEKNEEFLALLDKDKDLIFDIEVEKIHELNDLYRDGSVLKKIIKPSYTTTNPDENSVLYFDYKIYDKDSNLIYSTCKDFLQLLPTQDDIPSMDERGTQKIFMDEYEISSALKRSLKIGKKLEEFELIINDPSRYTYGQDYKKVLKVIGDKPLASVFPLKYRVKVYFFSSGENCYTMGVTEKIKYCEMKKPKIATLLKEGVYDKAKKMLMKVQEMTEKVDKHNRSPESISEELDKLFPYRKSALLNLTLCLWKLKEWKELVILARKIIDTGVDPTNPKLLYRLLLGLYESKHYDEVLSSFNKYSEQIFSGLDRADIDKQYPEIIEIYKKSEIMEKNIQAKEKNMYSGILGALGEK